MGKSKEKWIFYGIGEKMMNSRMDNILLMITDICASKRKVKEKVMGEDL